MSVHITDLERMFHQHARVMDERLLVYRIKTSPKVKKPNPDDFFLVVTHEIKKRLRLHSKEDIKQVLCTLGDLREWGVLAVWDEIQAAVIRKAYKKLDEKWIHQTIESVKTMELDMKSLGLYVAHQIGQIDTHHELSKKIIMAMRIAVPTEQLFSPSFFSEQTKTRRKMCWGPPDRSEEPSLFS